MVGIQATQTYLSQMGIDIDVFRYLVVGGLLFTRIFFMVMFIPFLGGKPIPGQVRMTLVMALTAFFFMPVYAGTTGALPQANGPLFALFLKEILFGLLLGLSISIIFYGVESAGAMVDNQRQLANARIFNPSIGAQSSLFGLFYYKFATVLFLVIGGHRVVFQSLAKTFQTVPLLTFPNIQPALSPMLDVLIRLGADTLVVTLQLSAPILVAIFLADLILGLTNRVAPMINVFELGFNIKGFAGNLLAYLSLPLIVYQLKVWFMKIFEQSELIVRFFMK